MSRVSHIIFGLKILFLSRYGHSEGWAFGQEVRLFSGWDREERVAVSKLME